MYIKAGDAEFLNAGGRIVYGDSFDGIDWRWGDCEEDTIAQTLQLSAHNQSRNAPLHLTGLLATVRFPNSRIL